MYIFLFERQKWNHYNRFCRFFRDRTNKIFIAFKTFEKQNSFEDEQLVYQFHQHFTSTFLVQKYLEQIFFTFCFCLHFFGKIILAQKLLIKCWWNWHQWSTSSTFYASVFCVKVLFCQNPLICQSQNVTREKLCKALL